MAWFSEFRPKTGAVDNISTGGAVWKKGRRMELTWLLLRFFTHHQKSLPRRMLAVYGLFSGKQAINVNFFH